MSRPDTYHVSLVCPVDGTSVTDWSGPDGAEGGYDWRLGSAEPDEAAEARLLGEDRERYLATFPDIARPDDILGESARAEAAEHWDALARSRGVRLPPVFRLRAACGDHDLAAFGLTDALGIWVEARVVEATIELPIGIDGGGHPEPIRIELFRADRADRAGLALRDAYRAARRADLAAYGGHAACANAAAHETPLPAAVWLRRFLCESCLEEALRGLPAAHPDALVR